MIVQGRAERIASGAHEGVGERAALPGFDILAAGNQPEARGQGKPEISFTFHAWARAGIQSLARISSWCPRRENRCG